MKLLFKLLLVLIVLAAAAVVGGYLLLEKDDIGYAELESRYTNSTSQFADLPNGVRMHYRDQGNRQGRALLLIHGFGVSLETWERWVTQLSDDYRLISLDLPGHGLTRAPAAYQPSITDFADAGAQLAAMLGVDKYTVIGSSMGGHAAWLLALRHPANVEAVVLSDAGGWYDSQRWQESPLISRLINDPRLVPYVSKIDPRPLMKRALEAAFADKSMVTNRKVNRYSDMARAPRHRRLLGAIYGPMSSAVIATKDKLAAIKVPTLIMWGDKDEVLPVADAYKFKDAIAGSKLIIYPNIGHLPHEEAYVLSARDLDAFLRGKPMSSEM